ncbi:pantetheine-phosphate adenylyltransferase [Candidatus Gottesmanbacteria bacterium]|nr:pantetheine-phosphate adenylyltransferase [Candidatus Gottesmanbacteria bacterium]
MYRMFCHVVVAGTFDRLHKGHEAVLRRAFAVSEQVTVGLTTDKYIHTYKVFNFQFSNFQTRKRALEQFLKKKNWLDRARIIALGDPYGPVVPQSPHDSAPPDVDAIVVSSETRMSAEEINEFRREAGWRPLAIIEVPMVPAEDLKTISSTRVRGGEIDREGRLVMPDNLRPELQKPLGRVLVGEEIKISIRSHLARQGETFIALITVGDVATKTLLDAGVVPTLSIIDGKVGRMPYAHALKQLTRFHLVKKQGETLMHVKSGPGYISQQAMKAVKATLATPVKQKAVIIVDGEEDLLALPAIAEAPLGSVVYYGQPHQGLVEVVVTSVEQKRALELLAKFT